MLQNNLEFYFQVSLILSIFVSLVIYVVLRKKVVHSVIFILLFALIFGVALIASSFLAAAGYSQQSLAFVEDAGLGLSMPAAVLIYLILYKKLDWGGVSDALGLKRGNISVLMIIGIGLLLFVAIEAVSLFVGLLGTLTNTQINTNVNVVLQGAPLWFYVFAAVIEPINEEILFRGLLVPRLGIFLSALLFGILHIGYNSTFEIEVIAAVIFGILSGYVYRKTGSLYPSILAHILINSLAILALFYV